MKISCSRYHEIDVGHRVVGQGGKCENVHGHRYRIEFHAQAIGDHMGLATSQLDTVGRIIDFGVIKSKLCVWLDLNWDHKYLCYMNDPLREEFMALPGAVQVPFNPTAENIAAYLVREVAPALMVDTGVVIWKVVVHETAKCSAEAQL